MPERKKPRPSGGKETQAERQARKRQRRADAGLRRLEVFVQSETPPAIDALKRHGEDRGAVIDRLVRERIA
jgi:hypothetical protein